MKILVDSLHGDLAVVGNEPHETGANVSDIIVVAQEPDVIANGPMRIRIPTLNVFSGSS